MSRNAIALGLGIAAIVISVASVVTMSYVEKLASAARGKNVTYETLPTLQGMAADPIPDGMRVEVSSDADKLVDAVEELAGVPLDAPLVESIRGYMANPTLYWQSGREVSPTRVELEMKCGGCEPDGSGGFRGRLLFRVDTRVSVDGSWRHRSGVIEAGTLSLRP